MERRWRARCPSGSVLLGAGALLEAGLLLVLAQGCVGENPDYCDENKPCPSGYACDPNTHGCVPAEDAGVEASVDGQPGPDAKTTDAGGDAAQKKNGTACTKHGECNSGFCVDDVCCDATCDGTCESCAVSGKEGTCSDVPSGSDPRKDCAGSSTACAGSCDGLGACLYPGTTSSCAADSCSSGKLTVHTCDGKGTCAATSQDCGGYVCASATACKTSCASAGDCTGSFTCINKVCSNVLDDGKPCGTNDAACKSKKCVDGVCCATDCTGTCMACDVSGKEGTCSAVPGGTDPDSDCKGTDALCSGSCDGGGKCSFPGASKQCKADSCSGSTLSEHACDGKGTCAASSSSCGVYTCNAAGDACRASCSANTHCTTKLCDVHDKLNTCPTASSICYVDAKYTGGTGTLAKPYATINQCLATSKVYISVADGTYNENLTISAKKVQIVAQNTPASVYAGAVPTVNLRPNKSMPGVEVKNKGDLFLEGFDVTTSVSNINLVHASDATVVCVKDRFHDTPSSMAGFCINAWNSTLKVIDSVTSGCEYGIYTNYAIADLDRVKATGNRTSGFYFEGSNTGSLTAIQIAANKNAKNGIEFNSQNASKLDRIIVQDNTDIGIQFGATCGAEVSNLLATGNKTGLSWIGSSCSGAGKNRVVNATIAFNTSYEIYCSVSGSGKLDIVNSIVWDTGGTATTGTECVFSYSDVVGGATGTTNIKLDPLFVDSAKDNFHLSNTSTKKSPCINAGDPSGSNLPKTDLDGANRVVGVVDMGAYEAK